LLNILLTTVFSLTSLLLWPVVLTLLLALFHSLFLLGDMWVERWERLQPSKAITQLDEVPQSMAKRHGIREWQIQRQLDPQADAWLTVDRTEAALAQRIDRARLWVRLGPSLGLCGTLIPLGPALMALAKNDLSSLSEGLILAFGTTVLGLIAGGFAWVVMSVQQRWYRLDLAEIRAAVDLHTGEQ